MIEGGISQPAKKNRAKGGRRGQTNQREKCLCRTDKGRERFFREVGDEFDHRPSPK